MTIDVEGIALCLGSSVTFPFDEAKRLKMTMRTTNNIVDENGVEFLMSYLDELRLRMKTQAKSIFDLDKSSLQNFLSKFVFWQSRNKDYDCLNDV